MTVDPRRNQRAALMPRNDSKCVDGIAAEYRTDANAGAAPQPPPSLVFARSAHPALAGSLLTIGWKQKSAPVRTKLLGLSTSTGPQIEVGLFCSDGERQSAPAGAGAARARQRSRRTRRELGLRA